MFEPPFRAASGASEHAQAACAGRRAVRRALAAVAFGAHAALACAAPGAPAAPLFEGLTPYHPRASTVSLAQRYFEQGMTLAWGFNPGEAVRSFTAATAADPRCAACWWALAWVQGPTINADMDAGAAARVGKALSRAQALASSAPRRYRHLIGALALRHPSAVAVDEEGYAASMRALARRFPTDAEIATLAAEAELNLHPYDWWERDGRPKEGSGRATDLLARALALEPSHPGANHYWIHLMEGSPHPARALPSADRLATLVPGSGHLLHMPAHVYMRTGRYGDALDASKRAIAADARYLARVDAQGAYRVGYVAHNHHFLWAAAAMQGRSAEAMAAAQAALPAACGPSARDRSSGILQQYFVLPYFTMVRFGRWRELLEDTLPPDVAQPYPLAIWHFARGTAYVRTGRFAEARGELAAVKRYGNDATLAAARIKNINPAQSIVRIAELTLAADIAAAEGRAGEGIGLLEQATAVEDQLAYDEPHLWLAPTRHALGAALLAASRYADAERVYREDLAHYPGNGWSLRGLAKAQRLRGDVEAARETERAFREAWRQADVE